MREPTLKDADRLCNAVLTGVQSHVMHGDTKTPLVPQAQYMLAAMLRMGVMIRDHPIAHQYEPAGPDVGDGENMP